MAFALLATLASTALLASAQIVRTDPGRYGPALEVAHLFYDEWPTGVTVSSTGRIFACYPSGLDQNNTYLVNSLGGNNGKYAVAELFSNNTERAYPSVAINSPPGGAINYTTNPLTSSNSQTHLIGVQSVVIDAQDTLWILDTGRAIDPASGMLTNAAYGGPKLVAVNLTTNQVIRTILFPTNVAYPDSYLNDVRFDLRTNLSGITGNQGVAYLTDSSTEGRNGIVIVDIGMGTSWRHLNGDPRVHAEQQFLPIVWGDEVYSIPNPGMPYAYLSFGADGIALGADGKDLYWTPLASRTLYSIPTERLRDQSNSSEVLAQAAVQSRGQKGVNDGMETDTNGFIYVGSVEDEAVNIYNPANGSVITFVRDPRINWVDTMSVANGSLYFTVNQLNYAPSMYPGTDRRIRPFVLFKAPLPNNGTKVTSYPASSSAASSCPSSSYSATASWYPTSSWS